MTQGRREVKVGVLLPGNDKNSVIANKDLKSKFRRINLK